jgi:hypothetical protein
MSINPKLLANLSRPTTQKNINNYFRNKSIVSFNAWNARFRNELIPRHLAKSEVGMKLLANWNAVPMNRKRQLYNNEMETIRKHQAGLLKPKNIVLTANQKRNLEASLAKIVEKQKQEASQKLLSTQEGQKIWRQAVSNVEHSAMFKSNKWFGPIPLNSHARLGASLNHLNHTNIHFKRMFNAAKAFHKKLGGTNAPANNAPANHKRTFIKSVARNHLQFFRTMNALKNASQQKAFMEMTPAKRIEHLAARAGPVPRGFIPHWNAELGNEPCSSCRGPR